jgi:alternate signal-mediated exported protein
MPSNKKVLKGTLTVATGTALLVGGFGSFALWSDTEPLPSAPISAGELTLQTQAESWVDDSLDAVTTVWNPATDKLVPGDTVTLTVPITVTAVGKNLAGRIQLDRAALDTAGFGPHFSVTSDIDPVGATQPGVTNEGDGSVSFLRSAMEGDQIDAVGTVTFALSSAASLSEAENATAVLSDAKFVITQVRPTEQP